MKNSPPQILQGCITAFQQALAEGPALQVKQTDAENQLADLSVNGDLGDEAVLNQIGRLQIFTQLFPARIQARERNVGPAVDNLRSGCMVFISHELEPRVNDLVDRVRAKVKAAMKKHFQNESALSAAVEESALMGEVKQIERATYFARASGLTEASLDADGLIRRAKSLLEVWQQADTFEAKFQPQP